MHPPRGWDTNVTHFFHKLRSSSLFAVFNKVYGDIHVNVRCSDPVMHEAHSVIHSPIHFTITSTPLVRNERQHDAREVFLQNRKRSAATRRSLILHADVAVRPSLHVCLRLWQCGQARVAALRRPKHVRAGQTFPGHSQTPNLSAHQRGSGHARQEAKPPRAIPKLRKPVQLNLSSDRRSRMIQLCGRSHETPFLFSTIIYPWQKCGRTIINNLINTFLTIKSINSRKFYAYCLCGSYDSARIKS